MLDQAELARFANDFLGSDARYKKNWARQGYRQQSLDPNDDYGNPEGGGGGGSASGVPEAPTGPKPHWRPSIDVKPFSRVHSDQKSPQALQQAGFNAKLKMLQAGVPSEKTLEAYTTTFVLGAG